MLCLRLVGGSPVEIPGARGSPRHLVSEAGSIEAGNRVPGRVLAGQAQRSLVQPCLWPAGLVQMNQVSTSGEAQQA